MRPSRQTSIRILVTTLFLTATLLGASTALATSFVRMPDEALVDQAPLIVYGTIVARTSAGDADRPATSYLLNVTERLKGPAAGAELTFSVPGGTRPDGSGLKIWAAPEFAIGEEVLLHLAPAPGGGWRILQHMLGAFHIRRHQGRPVAVQDLSEAVEFAPDGRMLGHPDEDTPRDLQQFRGWIRDRARGDRRPGDYRIESDPQAVESLTQPFAFQTSGGDRIRWFTFDQGMTVSWRSHVNGVPEMSGGGATEFQNGLAAWTNDGGSNVRYGYSGTTTASAGFTAFDDINVILFEDPNNEISGTYSCTFGGTLAIGGPWFSSSKTFQGETFREIIGADVVTQNGAGCFFVGNGQKDGEEVFAHELGHTLGLGHSAVTEALMYGIAHGDGRGAQLHPDDQAGIADLYPTSGVNSAPTISDIPNQTIPEDGSTGPIAFTVSDAETSASLLTVTRASTNTTLVPLSGIVLGGSGGNRTVTVTPAANQSGSATITLTVSDGSLTASDTFSVTVTAVNDPPTITSISDRTIPENGSTGPISFTIADPETAPSALTVSRATTNPTLVPLSGISLTGTGGLRTVTVTPAANQTGTATITLTVSDGSLSASEAFTVTVTEAPNTPPTISNVPNQTVEVNGTTGPIGFTVTDAETDEGSLVVTRASSNTTLVPLSGIVLGGSGSSRTVTVTPATGQTGSAVITLTVSDGELTVSDTFTVTVTAPNTAPTISAIGNQTIAEDATTGPISFTVGDAETTAGLLEVTRDSSNTTLIPLSGIVLGGSGGSRSVSVAPAPNRTGTATVTLTVSDGSLTASESFSVTVTAVNDPPSITPIPDQETTPGTPVGPIAFIVSDPDNAAGTLTLAASSSNTTLLPTSGIVFGGSGGSRTVTLSPAAGQTGVALVTVTVSDGSLSSSTDLQLTVNETGGTLLSYADTGLLGVRRTDGGDDRTNFAPGTSTPRLGIDFHFEVLLTDPSGQPPSRIRLVLNGVGYDMALLSGTPATGALYRRTVRLGPKAAHRFHFEALDGAGSVIDRLPATGEASGPRVELLNGANMVGIPGNTASVSLSADPAFGTTQAFRWDSQGLTTGSDNGSYLAVNQSGPVEPAEGYFVQRPSGQATLPDPGVGALPGTSFTQNLEPGWNMVALPFEGLLSLGELRVRRGSASPVSWLQAAGNGWLVNAAYLFNGSDWGGTYGFLTDQGQLVSWLGYWIYLARDDATYSLIFPKPGD